MTRWDTFRRWLPAFAEAMDFRYYTPEWLAGEVWSGRARFWCNDRAAIVAEIRTYPTGAHDVHFLVAAGDPASLRDDLAPQAEAWGRSLGCIGAIIESRPAWARVMKHSGYEPHQLAVRKELN